MVVNCAVLGCSNTSGMIKGLHFHRFPLANISLSEMWIQAVNRPNWKPTKHSTLCSNHFTKDDYIGYKLKSHAVPNIFNIPKVRRLIETNDVHEQISETLSDEAVTGSSLVLDAVQECSSSFSASDMKISDSYTAANQTSTGTQTADSPKKKKLKLKIKNLQRKLNRRNQKLNTVKDFVQHLQQIWIQ